MSEKRKPKFVDLLNDLLGKNVKQKESDPVDPDHLQILENIRKGRDVHSRASFDDFWNTEPPPFGQDASDYNAEKKNPIENLRKRDKKQSKVMKRWRQVHHGDLNQD